jgi:hypothetical protein
MVLRLALVAALCGWPLAAVAQTLTHVEITTADAPALAAALEREGFDVVEGSVKAGRLEVIASDQMLALLEERGFEMRVLGVSRPLAEVFGEDIPPGYPDLAAINTQLQQAAANYPAICQFVDLTTTFGAPVTYEGRHMYAVKVSDNVAQDEDEPTFLLVACHHAREIVTPVIALYALEQFTTKYGVDPRITTLVDNYEIWIAPVWNPDGYQYMYYTSNMWRKNRTVFTGGIGVDQNRNYPFGWSSSCSGSTSPSSDTYKGPSPASESETQTMILLSNDRHFTKVVDYHSSGREVLPGYCCHTHPFDAYLDAEATAISQASGYGGAIRTPSAEGEEQEWQLAKRGTYGFLIETHTEFQPTYASAQAEAQMVFPGALYILERPIPLSGHVTDAVTHAPVVADIELVGVNFPNGETNYSEPRFGRYHVFAPPGNYQVRFSAAGYEPQVIPVTIVANTAKIVEVQLAPPTGLRVRPWDGLHALGPHGGPFSPEYVDYTLENLDPTPIEYQVTKTANWLVLTNAAGTILPAGSAVVRVAIGPAANVLPNGNYTDVVQFVNLTNHVGDTTRDVLLEVGVPTVQYAWNMDTNPGWSISGGLWAWGKPTGGGGAYGGPDPTSGYTGLNVYGYNLNGDYTNNMPEYHLTTAAIDCSSLTQTSLRFRRWLGVERFTYDKAYLRISTDGANWFNVWNNPDSETADLTWVAQEFDISTWADNRPTVYLRWTMGITDSGWTYCGWNIDDVEIWGVEAQSYPVGDLNCDGNVDFGDINPFVLALTNPAGYAVQFPNCDIRLGDINGDGRVDFGDINPFVRLLTGP